MTKQVSAAREIAFEVLYEILEKKNHSHLVLRQALQKHQYLEKQDRALITRLTEGTLENLIRIDYTIDQYSKTKVRSMKPVIRTVLRMAVDQICFLDGVPDRAACDEAVKFAKKRGFAGLSGFVNGVLRTISRNKEQIPFPLREDGLIPFFSICYSMPEWILEEWLLDYDADTVESILQGFRENQNQTPVRVHLGRADIAAVVASLEGQGITVTRQAFPDSVLHLEGYDYLDKVEAFQKGLISVQDAGAAMVGEVLDIPPDAYVIDVCAAPGGKALHIADRLGEGGCVEARDLTLAKLSYIEDNIRRTGETKVRVKLQDALVRDEASRQQADLLIADLPCSGLGIIGKKPDIKYNITKNQMVELAQLQRDILNVVSDYVKPGGILVYSTCTISKRENQENLQWFLENYPFEAVSLENKMGRYFHKPSLKEGWIQLLPGEYPGDGFFFAVLKRQTE